MSPVVVQMIYGRDLSPFFDLAPIFNLDGHFTWVSVSLITCESTNNGREIARQSHHCVRHVNTPKPPADLLSPRIQGLIYISKTVLSTSWCRAWQKSWNSSGNALTDLKLDFTRSLYVLMIIDGFHSKWLHHFSSGLSGFTYSLKKLLSCLTISLLWSWKIWKTGHWKWTHHSNFAALLHMGPFKILI